MSRQHVNQNSTVHCFNFSNFFPTDHLHWPADPGAQMTEPSVVGSYHWDWLCHNPVVFFFTLCWPQRQYFCFSVSEFDFRTLFHIAWTSWTRTILTGSWYQLLLRRPALVRNLYQLLCPIRRPVWHNPWNAVVRQFHLLKDQIHIRFNWNPNNHQLCRVQGVSVFHLQGILTCVLVQPSCQHHVDRQLLNRLGLRNLLQI